jgi:UDP-galactopyranose mutase
VLQEQGSGEYILWYYTPMALLFSRHLKPLATVYDCMDELSGFHGCPPELRLLERELMSRADVMFTGGHSLYESKRSHHPNVHPFPSSVDLAHFGQARTITSSPEDQENILGPRIGFHGVIDERMDIELVREVASARPDWQLVLIGPVVKIDPNSLPRLSNIHYLGSKSYEQLPGYLAGWDVTILPFALNEATRYISPTKTPEYLAGGKAVVSTAIHDVVKPYGELGLVKIAHDAAEFVAGIEAALSGLGEAWQRKVDHFLSGLSWDRTWNEMRGHIQQVVEGRSSSIKQVSK